MVRRQVTTRYGTIEGLAADDPDITVFRGVPFAAPPVGALRWRAPQPAEAWDGVLQAHDFAASPMQPQWNPDDFYGREWGMDPDTPRDEDCLYLNIWTPALRGTGTSTTLHAEAKPDGASEPTGPGLPVMVWIYGGAYQCGTPAEKEFDGAALARLGVIVVSIAYRLNAFGFLTHRDLATRAQVAGEPCANFGLLDQRAGIDWVRRNIAAFGGDPERITVFGQSAGAASTLAQICSPMNDGLFRRAIMQSGAGLGVFNAHLPSLADAQDTGRRFLDLLDVADIDEARRIPADELLDAAGQLPVPPDSGRDGDWPMLVNWVPCIDGRFLTAQYGDTLRAGRMQCETIMIGNTTGEFLDTLPDGTTTAAGELGNLALADAWMAGGGVAPYYYRFDVAMPGDDAGAFHSSDLWFTFDSLGTCWRPFDGWHYELADAMSRHWANFAVTGDPNGPDRHGDPLPHWERFDPHTRAAMRFAEHGGMQYDW